MRERKSEGRGDVEVSGETKGKMVILFIILTPLALVNGRGESLDYLVKQGSVV